MGWASAKLFGSPKRSLLSILLAIHALHASAQPGPNVRAWGDNSFGQCDVPADLTNAVAIAAGSGYSLALRANGTVTEWGRTPSIPLPTLSNVVAISAGE